MKPAPTAPILLPHFRAHASPPQPLRPPHCLHTVTLVNLCGYLHEGKKKHIMPHCPPPGARPPCPLSAASVPPRPSSAAPPSARALRPFSAGSPSASTTPSAYAPPSARASRPYSAGPAGPPLPPPPRGQGEAKLRGLVEMVSQEPKAALVASPSQHVTYRLRWAEETA